MLYIWSKKDPDVIVNFWFGFQFKAYQFPFALIVFRVLMGSDIKDDIAGLLAGHLYYYLKEVLPKEYGYNLLETPQFLKNYFNVVPNFQRANSGFVGRGYRVG
jgi:Derlin-2/3